MAAIACFGRLKERRRHHRAADGGAFLPGLDRHLVDDLGDEQVEFRRARRGVGAEDRGIEAVLLGDELDALALDHRVRAQLERGLGRAGEAHHVLPGQMIEQVADPADDQLHRAGRQDVGLDHHPERGFGQPGGGAGRLHDRGNAREQGRRQLLQHPPDREVEGVDVDRHALQRGVDVLALEQPRLAQRLEPAVEQDMRVGQLAAALAGEGQQGAGAAFDVDPAVLAGRAGGVVELVQLLLAGEDGEAERLQHPRALVEGQRPQRRSADLAGEARHAAEIEPA